jgi:predicted small lipoprotein YifL
MILIVKSSKARNTFIRRVVLTTLAGAATLLISACGQPGPLYLPKPPAKPAPQASSTPPAAPAATPTAANN